MADSVQKQDIESEVYSRQAPPSAKRRFSSFQPQFSQRKEAVKPNEMETETKHVGVVKGKM